MTVAVDIVNPCETTTINSLVFTGGSYSAGVLTVTDTQQASVTFPRPTTTAEDSNAVVSVCGATSYTVHNDQSGGTFAYDANWAVIDTSTNPITFTIDTAADTSLIDSETSKTITVYIKASLDDYTSYTRETYT